MLDLNEATITLRAEQDDCSVKGSAVAWGDDAHDKAIEDEINERLGHGDIWAWAAVTVEARIEGISHVGIDTLGCCC